MERRTGSLGRYEIVLGAYESILDHSTRFEYTVHVEQVDRLIAALTSALAQVRRRQLIDVLCAIPSGGFGVCAVCAGSRMINDPPKGVPEGSSWQVACPVCGPKIAAYDEGIESELHGS